MRLGLSLRARLLSRVLLAICAVLVASEWSDYRSAGETAQLVHDTILAASARAIAEQIREQDGVLQAVIPPSALERLSTAQRDRVVYQVTAPDGELLAGYGDMPKPAAAVNVYDPVWYDATFRTMPIRAVAIGQPLPGSRSDFATVLVGETVNGRQAMVADLYEGTLWREALTGGVIAVLVYFGLRAGLAPLTRLRRIVLARGPRSLALLDQSELPSELKPLVGALNASIARVADEIEQKRRLIVDASHQLRTPLALLRTQAAVGLRSEAAGGKDEALAAIAGTASDMTRLANQLLLLARVEAAEQVGETEIVDLGRTVRNVLAAQASRALASGIDLALDESEAPVPVNGNATMLTELAVNLVDNALKYTPPGGAVTVGLCAANGAAWLRVADTGPGIPEAARARVFDRFYRVPGAAGEGSGLGLSIAAEIVRAHAGQIALSAPAQGPGLVVEVSLPLA